MGAFVQVGGSSLVPEFERTPEDRAMLPAVPVGMAIRRVLRSEERIFLDGQDERAGDGALRYLFLFPSLKRGRARFCHEAWGVLTFVGAKSPRSRLCERLRGRGSCNVPVAGQGHRDGADASVGYGGLGPHHVA